MEKTANEIQKERKLELEKKADELLQRCEVATLTSVNDKGFPRTCVLGLAKKESFHDLYFITGKRSEKSGKIPQFEGNNKSSVCYYLGNDSVTLIGTISFILNREEQKQLYNEAHNSFFPKGIDDPKFRLLRFHTLEATFWIEGKFRTCTYK